MQSAAAFVQAGFCKCPTDCCLTTLSKLSPAQIHTVYIVQYLMGRLLCVKVPLSTCGERCIARIFGPMLSGDSVGTRSHL